jgi:hypothetical protein
MLRPNHFGYNAVTAASNVFQQEPAHLAPMEIHRRAVREFEGLRNALEQAGVHVVVFDDTEEPQTPDAIFPNNWLSTHESGTLILYPMQGENRRLERRSDVVQWLMKSYGFGTIVDLTPHELQGRYLEGTGSMVLDRQHGLVYACRSSRTDAGLIAGVLPSLGYQEAIVFAASVVTNEETGFRALHPVYHTNVMMAIGERTAVVCAEVIMDSVDRGKVMSSLWANGYNVVEITKDQLHQFAGNMLQLQADGGPIWVMSEQAHRCLTPHQRSGLLSDGSRIIHVPLDTIELVGGGSARCMLAEIFHPSG